MVFGHILFYVVSGAHWILDGVILLLLGGYSLLTLSLTAFSPVHVGIGSHTLRIDWYHMHARLTTGVPISAHNCILVPFSLGTQ